MSRRVIQEDIAGADAADVVLVAYLSIEVPPLLSPFIIILEYYYVFILFIINSSKPPYISAMCIFLSDDRGKCRTFITNIIIFMSLTSKLPQVMLIVLIGLYKSIYSSLVRFGNFGTKCLLVIVRRGFVCIMGVYHRNIK
jgi:hypothetical protein